MQSEPAASSVYIVVSGMVLWHCVVACGIGVMTLCCGVGHGVDLLLEVRT